jgi:hypothetical protein
MPDTAPVKKLEGKLVSSENGHPQVPADARFVYTNLNGQTTTITDCAYENRYIFDPKQFTHMLYPVTWPPGQPWPPQSIEEICCAPGQEAGLCHGSDCYNLDNCLQDSCHHSLDEWLSSSGDWRSRFELRETRDRGVGVFAIAPIKRLEILGWYAGDVTPFGLRESHYKLSLTIGKAAHLRASASSSDENGFYTAAIGDAVEEEVTVDAKLSGNWTRFVNHSCKANTTFARRRIGAMRIMAVRAKQDIATDTELTIHYGDEYFESRTCLCGAENCVEVRKREEKRQKEISAVSATGGLVEQTDEVMPGKKDMDSQT